MVRTLAIDAVFSHARPVRETLPWNKAFSYSGAGHLALIAFLLLMKVTGTPLPTTVLTEINLVQREETVAPVTRAPERAPSEPSRGVVKGVSPDSQVLKSKLEVNATGTAPAGVAATDAGGDKPGQEGSIAPLAGPIVATEPIGFVGRRTGALVELSHRSGGSVGAAPDGALKGTARMADPIALGKMGVDEIRRKESSIGTPLVSGKVLSDGLSTAGGRGLAGNADAEARRKAALETLKSNPLDADKWGKQKGPFSMEGPLKYRKILKMELPPYPRWAEEKAIEATVSIRLWVDPRGKVKDNMYLEKTSGYSELDHIAIEALKAFVFVAMPANVTQEDEWGVATFRFELKR